MKNENLDLCAERQDLAGQNQISCTGSQTTSCQALLERNAAQIASFQRAVVLIAAPSSLATKANRLQFDLLRPTRLYSQWPTRCRQVI